MKDFLEPDKKFYQGGKELKLKSGERNITHFWRWAYSDLIQNITRGVLAEFLVAWTLDLDYRPRNPWDAYDLKTKDGKRIEVKSTGYLQDWYRNGERPKKIRPKFVICQTREWSAENGMQKEPSFNADVYVLCYHKKESFEGLDPMDLNQWEFWAFTKKEIIKLLDGRKSISVSQLKKEGFEAININSLIEEV